MKKKLLAIVSTMLLGIMLLTVLCGCSTYGKVLKAFEKDGWTEVESVATTQDQIKKYFAEDEDYESILTVHTLKKEADKDASALESLGSALSYAVILEFDSTEKMDEEIKNNESLKALIKDAQNSDIVSGTCVLLFATNPSAYETFKSTK